MNDSTRATVTSLEGGLIVSCQPVRGGALDDPAIVAAFVRAAEAGGARGIRVEGLDDLRAARQVTRLPIVGLVKSEFSAERPFITVGPGDVDALAAAGADVIAFDGTDRPRATSVPETIERIHALGALAMADCATFEDGAVAAEHGADFVTTTLSGYTTATEPRDEPDLDMLGRLVAAGHRVVAEGHIRTPEQAARARAAGAFAVTVGSAITRPELVTDWFAHAIEDAVPRRA